METPICPNGNILSAKDIGRIIRKKRKNDGLTQSDAAALCGVGTRFLSDLERGKETIQIGKALRILQRLGLELHITLKGVRR